MESCSAMLLGGEGRGVTARVERKIWSYTYNSTAALHVESFDCLRFGASLSFCHGCRRRTKQSSVKRSRGGDFGWSHPLLDCTPSLVLIPQGRCPSFRWARAKSPLITMLIVLFLYIQPVARSNLLNCDIIIERIRSRNIRDAGSRGGGPQAQGSIDSNYPNSRAIEKHCFNSAPIREKRVRLSDWRKKVQKLECRMPSIVSSSNNECYVVFLSKAK